MNLKLILIIASLVLLAGCVSTQPPASKTTATSLAGAKENIEATTQAIAAARPHADSVGQAQLDLGTRSANAGLKNIAEGIAYNDWFVEHYWKVQNELTWAENTIGFRVEAFIKRSLWVIGIGGTLLAIGIVLVKALMPTSILSTIANVILGFFPGHIVSGVNVVSDKVASAAESHGT